jgi:hypothetical protein
MKNSIGSLAALTATLAAAPAALHAIPERDTRTADFNNVSVSLFSNSLDAIGFDIDGDGTNDFAVFGNNGNGIRLDLGATTQMSAAPVTFGTAFFANNVDVSIAYALEADFSGYHGFSFITGGQTHVAWVQFDLNASSPVVIGGGWEAVAGYDSIIVGDPAPSPVPEPSSYAALAGAAALTGAFALRRRRRV